jgi:hypothetical protein
MFWPSPDRIGLREGASMDAVDSRNTVLDGVHRHAAACMRALVAGAVVLILGSMLSVLFLADDVPAVAFVMVVPLCVGTVVVAAACWWEAGLRTRSSIEDLHEYGLRRKGTVLSRRWGLPFGVVRVHTAERAGGPGRVLRCVCLPGQVRGCRVGEEAEVVDGTAPGLTVFGSYAHCCLALWPSAGADGSADLGAVREEGVVPVLWDILADLQRGSQLFDVLAAAYLGMLFLAAVVAILPGRLLTAFLAGTPFVVVPVALLLRRSQHISTALARFDEAFPPGTPRREDALAALQRDDWQFPARDLLADALTERMEG